MAIRYDKQLEREINRTIKNFNQKIARLEKDERELLPDKITKKELKTATTRRELLQRLKSLQRFSKRGAENIIETRGGIKTTQYTINELKRNAGIVKAKLTREIKKLETTKPKVFGKEQSRTFAEMGDTYYLNLIARRKALEKNINVISPDEYDRWLKLLEKTSTKQKGVSQFKENYIEMLTDLAYYTNYDQTKLDIIKDRIRELDASKFDKLFSEDKSIKAILDYYPIMTGRIKGMNPDDIKADVISLYDNLYENLDYILKDYA